MNPCYNLLQLAHASISRALAPGSLAIDATVGNGYDTLFLARQVGEDGLVAGFEIQPQALAHARALLRQENMHGRVKLFACGHESMAARLGEGRRPHAVMFNLGFLPGSDKKVVTMAETTLSALEQAVSLLRPGGVLSIHCYSGHQGGQEESDAVLAWARGLSWSQFKVYCYQALNKKRGMEYLLLLERQARKG